MVGQRIFRVFQADESLELAQLPCYTEMNSKESPEDRRPIRSFVRRPGRLTGAQAKALEELWPTYGIELRQLSRYELIFGRTAPVVAEVGFGNGESLAELAHRHPDIDYLGIEVHEPGIGHLLLLAQRLELSNLRVVRADAAQLLRELPRAGLAAVNLFFPDPWPKKRHHKRRLVQPVFLQQVARVLVPQGLFHFASDWSDYVEHVIEVAEESVCFSRVESADVAYGALAERPETKFERRGLRLGHSITDLYYTLNSQR